MDNLRCNLQEIYAATKNEDTQGLSLVANIWGTRLYHSASSWGRMWVWLYYLLNDFSPGIQTNRLCQAMQHTHLLFRENLKKIDSASSEYLQMFERKINKTVSDNSQLLSCRQLLKDWHESTRTLLKEVEAHSNAKLANLCYLGFQEQFKFSPSWVPFSYGKIKKRLSFLQKAIALEDDLHTPLPVSALYKASLQAKHSKEERSSFLRFAKKLKKHAPAIGVRRLHRTLYRLVEHFKTIHPADSKNGPSLEALEMALFEQGCHVFLQKDHVHIAWRDSLKTGDMIVCDEREYILDQRLGVKKENEEDLNHVYAVQKQPEIVVSIGVNECTLGLKEQAAKDHGWGIKTVKHVEKDPKGRFALIERLYDPLDGYPWKSSKEQISRHDENIATPLWRLLQWFLEQERTPGNFLPKYLMFNRKGRLKSLKPALEGEFDFNALVDFADRASNGNPKIFQFLMEASGLTEHRYAKFYEDIVQRACRNDCRAPEEIAAVSSIVDQKIIRRAKALSKEARDLIEESLYTLHQNYDMPKAGSLEKTVADNLLFVYRIWGAAGFLPGFLKEMLIEETVRSEQIVKKNVLKKLL